MAAYRSCRLWRRVKMSWIHYLLCDHHWTQCRHAISDTGHVTQIRILEDPRWPPKRCWQDVRQGYLTIVRPWCWKGSDLMYRHSVIFSISLSVGFLDSLHDPSAYVAPHNISDVAIPVYKHLLTPLPPGFFQNPVCRVSTVWQDTAFSPLPSDISGQSRARWSIQGPGSVADSSLGNQVPATEIPQVVTVCFLWRTHIFPARHSKRAGMSTVLPKPMLTETHISWSGILGEWRHPRIPRQHHHWMRMAVSAMITTQDEGPTWAWFCVAPDVPAGKLWRLAWCASRLLDRTPNDVAQKAQTCDVILSSMGEVRLWRGASYRCWNDDFWLETHLFDLQNATNLHQWDSYTWSDDSQRHLDIMLAASLEWPFALRMARSVSTRVDLTAGSDESWSPCRLSKRLASAGLDLRRTAGLDLHGTDPLTPETTTLPVAVERSKSPWLLVTERFSAELEGPSWMAGTCTGGPSRCPTAWTWHLSTLP